MLGHQVPPFNKLYQKPLSPSSNVHWRRTEGSWITEVQNKLPFLGSCPSAPNVVTWSQPLDGAGFQEQRQLHTDSLSSTDQNPQLCRSFDLRNVGHHVTAEPQSDVTSLIQSGREECLIKHLEGTQMFQKHQCLSNTLIITTLV